MAGGNSAGDLLNNGASTSNLMSANVSKSFIVSYKVSLLLFLSYSRRRNQHSSYPQCKQQMRHAFYTDILNMDCSMHNKYIKGVMSHGLRGSNLSKGNKFKEIFFFLGM